MDEYGCAQVTMNLVDLSLTGLHTAYDRVTALARKLGADTAGSEIVGLVPEGALLEAGCHYLSSGTEREARGANGAALIREASERLGLHSVRSFDPERKILQRRLRAELGIASDLEKSC